MSISLSIKPSGKPAQQLMELLLAEQQQAALQGKIFTFTQRLLKLEYVQENPDTLTVRLTEKGREVAQQLIQTPQGQAYIQMLETKAKQEFHRLLHAFNQQLQQAAPESQVTFQGTSLYLDDHELIHAPLSELEDYLKEHLIPKVTKLQRAFPIPSNLPMPAPPLEDLPKVFQENSHLACKAATEIMFKGNMESVELYPRFPITQEQGDDIISLVICHLKCFEYKFEQKIGWCGLLLDRWFKVIKKEKTHD